MTITVKFFSSLRENLGRESEILNPSEVRTVNDVWLKATDGAEIPSNVLVAVNMDYVNLGDRVQDGDEVAFFPPVTGG